MYIRQNSLPFCCSHHFLCSVCVLVIIGKDPDVGEVLVKSLQNTKYSIDEKLEKSFISLFGRKPNMLSEAQNDAKDDHETVEQVREIEPSGSDHSGEEIEADESDEESDGDAVDGLESSDQDEGIQKDAMIKSKGSGSDEENAYALKQQSPRKDHLQEHVEYHGGRLRRKAFFGNDVDHDNLKVNDAGNHYMLSRIFF
jgi:ribosome biogenesis protein BMS1